MENFLKEINKISYFSENKIKFSEFLKYWFFINFNAQLFQLN